MAGLWQKYNQLIISSEKSILETNSTCSLATTKKSTPENQITGNTWSSLKKGLRVIKKFSIIYLKKIFPSPLFLEFGAGYAQGSILLTNRYHAEGFASDISDKTLSSGKNFLRDLGFKKMPALVACDANELPFKDNSFNFVFCFQTLHHFPDPKPIFAEVYRVLKPGGYFYFGEEPVAQAVNLNLWRRDMHLTRLEKILKVTGILHFISRIGKSEVDNHILEETFDLATWKKALDVFNESEVKIKIFPFGPAFDGIRPPILLDFLLRLMGGGIDGLCRKQPKSKFKAHKNEGKKENIQDLMINLNGKKKFTKKNNVYILFNKENEKKTLPLYLKFRY